MNLGKILSLSWKILSLLQHRSDALSLTITILSYNQNFLSRFHINYFQSKHDYHVFHSYLGLVGPETHLRHLTALQEIYHILKCSSHSFCCPSYQFWFSKSSHVIISLTFKLVYHETSCCIVSGHRCPAVFIMWQKFRWGGSGFRYFIQDTTSCAQHAQLIFFSRLRHQQFWCGNLIGEQWIWWDRRFCSFSTRYLV